MFIFFLAGLNIKAQAGQAAQEIVVALNHFPPWLIADKDKPEGIDVEIVEALASRLSLTVRYARCPGPRCLAMMRDGVADLITGLFKTPERQEYMDFIEPAYTISPPIVFYVKAQGGVRINAYEDLRSLGNIGMTAGTSYFRQFDTDGTLKKFEVVQTSQLLNLLDIGRIDTFLSNESQADYLIITEGFQGKITKAPLQYGMGEYSYLALSKKSPHIANINAFNRTIADMVSTGVIERLEATYFRRLSKTHHE